MKKIIATMMMLAAVVALATGCSEHESEISKQNKAAQEELEAYMATQATGGAADKVPDPNAPILEVISVYSVKDGDKGIEMNMSDCPEIDDYELTKKLIEFGTLPETAEVIDIDQETGILEYTAAPDLTARQAIAIINTFAENMGWEGQITLKVDGEEILTSGFESDYKNVTDDYQGGADDLGLTAGGPGAK